MRGEQFYFQMMLATRKSGGSMIVAEIGLSDSGQCARGMDEEKKWYSLGL